MIFREEKLAKQVLNAAKRISRKRPAPSDGASALQKRPKGADLLKTGSTPYEIESALCLPVTAASEETLNNTVLFTNRAPLVLAFAVCVLKYTMPEQPLSSRLSLAQTVVSANSRTKAAHLGIEDGVTAEQEGLGQGHPVVKVLGRDIHVLKRWDYDPNEGAPSPQDESKHASQIAHEETQTPPLWGVDLESLRDQGSKNKKFGEEMNAGSDLPIFRAESARSYLYRAFSRPPEDKELPPKKKAATAIETEKEECLSRLLHTIDLVCQSWLPKLEKEELDRRAWSWYIRVRPEVQHGTKGWGEKGLVKLADILALQRGR